MFNVGDKVILHALLPRAHGLNTKTQQNNYHMCWAGFLNKVGTIVDVAKFDNQMGYRLQVGLNGTIYFTKEELRLVQG